MGFVNMFGEVTYVAEYELRVIGYLNPVIADDVLVGDIIQDAEQHRRDLWFKIDDLRYEDNGDVTLQLSEATAGEVAKARRDACEGHETTLGAIGSTFYCDGSCTSPRA